MNRLIFLARYKYTPSYISQAQYIQQVPVNYFSIGKDLEENETRYNKYNEKIYTDYANCDEWNKQVNIKNKKNKDKNEIEYDDILGLEFPSSRF